MDRKAFKQRMQELKSYRELNPGKGYLEWKANLPKNLQDDRDYNLHRAYELDYKPEYVLEDLSYHLPTRDRESGEILKKPYHPTFLIGLLEDSKMGYYPQFKNGKTYTTTWEGNEKSISQYKDGGETRKTIKTEPPYPSVYKGTRLNPYTGLPLAMGLAKPFLDLEDAANLTPIGDAITIKDMGLAAAEKDWEGLGWASLGLIPFVPSGINKARKMAKGPVKPVILRGDVPKVHKDLIIKLMLAAVDARDLKALRYADDFYLKDEMDAINARNLLVELLSKDKKYYKRAKEVDSKFGTEYEKTYDRILNTSLLPTVKMDPDLGINHHGRMDLDDEAAIDMTDGIAPLPKDFIVSINPNGQSSKGILDHEMSHFADALQSTNSTKSNPLGIPYYENSLINGSRNNSTFKDWSTYLQDNKDMPISEKDYDYLTRGTEEKAFINTIRTDMVHRGIIKKRTQDPTKKQLKEYLNLPDIDLSIVKLSRLYKDTTNGLYKAARTMPYLATSGLTAYGAMKAQKEIYDENNEL